MGIKITAFHTCHLQGSPQQIYDSVPYASDRDKEQWLGQGYYFWTDSCFFAKEWGALPSKYPNGYVITKFEIEIPIDNFLDLVGNVVHQLKFEEQIRSYFNRMQIIFDKEHAKTIPISKMLDHFRSEAKEKNGNGENFFSYSAIKAADIANLTFSYPYSQGDIASLRLGHKLYLPTRQQIYIAPEYADCLKDKDLYLLSRRVKSMRGYIYQPVKIPVVRKTK
ncbi:hypothetical protein E0H82_02640 [Acinetobacter sp. ANC 4910]|uniref:hypothetical protein n=1 Tax=Acinetobacter sp. ANC 4910 TaxID=2529850 RepID=UPI00103A328E|nr:hypothetical protein [Acinetobacter sp. ANC 4910]TCB37520.1 hypothetical protein E0H82_02640 [Acinetobacter sp. ANC 4910]